MPFFFVISSLKHINATLMSTCKTAPDNNENKYSAFYLKKFTGDY